MISISLIISTYNRPTALCLTLESLSRQSHLPDEVIIADDGSAKETGNVVREYQQRLSIPLIHCYHEDNGFRLAAIRNKAIAIASSEYIVSIDGDLILHKHFIKDHLHIASSGCYVQGSRVLMSQKLTLAIEGKSSLPRLRWFSQGISNRLNAMRIPWLSKEMSKKPPFADHMKGVRGCNMAFWKDEFVKVNGFNEEFIGWGREDSELVVRFRNNGIGRKNLKFGGIAFHLFHPERSRGELNRNDTILEKTILQNLKQCPNGIDKYLIKKRTESL